MHIASGLLAICLGVIRHGTFEMLNIASKRNLKRFNM